MWPHCLLFVHLGPCACIQIGCLLVEEGGGGGGGATRHIPGNTFQSAAAAACLVWEGSKSSPAPLFTPLQFTVQRGPQHPPSSILLL